MKYPSCKHKKHSIKRDDGTALCFPCIFHGYRKRKDYGMVSGLIRIMKTDLLIDVLWGIPKPELISHILWLRDYAFPKKALKSARGDK